MKKTLLSSLLLANIVLTPLVTADTIETDVIDETWGKPTLVFGGAVTQADSEKLYQIFGTSESKVAKQLVTGPEMDKYLGTVGADTSVLHSSVLVTKTKNGKVDVEVKTPDKITKITDTQYANAAITAGATSVKIEVASVPKVTGESALTGVYKALEANGEKIDSERTQQAQEELATINEMSTNLSEEDSVSLDNTLAQVKTDLAEYKDKNGDIANNTKVEEIVNKAVEVNGLSELLTPADVEKLVALAEGYQATSAIDDKEVRAALANLQDEMANRFDKIKDALNNSEAKAWYQKIGAFVQDIFSKLTSFMKR